MSLAKLFVWLWKARPVPPQNPDVIVPICYGTLPERLAEGTEATLNQAIVLAQKYPQAMIAFGNAAICFPGSEVVESREKRRLLSEAGIPLERLVEAPAIYNSVTEAREIKAELARNGIATQEIAIVAAEAHSRSVMYIYRRVFPHTLLSLVLVPFEVEYQKDHTVTLQTGPWYWIVANVLRQTALMFLGLDIVGGITHHTKVRS